MFNIYSKLKHLREKCLILKFIPSTFTEQMFFDTVKRDDIFFVELYVETLANSIGYGIFFFILDKVLTKF